MFDDLIVDNTGGTYTNQVDNATPAVLYVLYFLVS